MESDIQKNEEKEDVTEQVVRPEFAWFNKVKKISTEKKEKVMILFLLGVFFLLVANPISVTSDKKVEEEESFVQSEVDTTKKNQKNNQKDEYINQLENKLEQTIEGMEGAGKVHVMITLKDSGEKILDKNQTYESSTEKSKEEAQETEESTIKSNPETVLIEEDGNTHPIIIQELYPDIEGVVVVCEGGDHTDTALRIKEAVQALFSVEAHKIVVCKLQQ